MDLHQLRCFVLAAEELHFGRAAQRADMLPAAFGRFIRLLEEDLGTSLFFRTTRNVELTDHGRRLLDDVRPLLMSADAIRARFRETVRASATRLRVGAIDSAAVGLIPALLNDFRADYPAAEIELVEDKTIRLLPRLLSGRLDIAFVRPPNSRDKALSFRHILLETPVLACPSGHALARRPSIELHDIADEPLIVPDRRSRPHSYDMTMKLFEAGGLTARIAQVADEKQTIVQLVATGLGLAIVPRWMSRVTLTGVTFVPLQLPHGTTAGKLTLAAAWVRGAKDPLRDGLLATLDAHVDRYAAQA